MPYPVSAVRSKGSPLESVPWYLAGGVAAANCKVAYQPIGAANLAASYVNLANPGTYDATAIGGAAPDFNAATGWTFVIANTDKLDTGWVPPNQVTRSMIIRLSNGATDTISTRYICGSRNGATRFTIQATSASSQGIFHNGSGAGYTHTTVSTGIAAIAGLDPYLDGVDLGNITAGTYDQSTFTMWIGALNNSGSALGPWGGEIQAIAFYDITLSSAQVSAIGTAMAALT